MSLDRHVFIRADGSPDLGLGHVVRCLALARYLECAGVSASWVCRDAEGNGLELLQRAGIRTHLLPAPVASGAAGTPPVQSLDGWEEDAARTRDILGADPRNRPPEWLVVDHYGLDYRWEGAVAAGRCKLLVVDDLVRPHACDMLVDATAGRQAEEYSSRVPQRCVLRTGAQYAMLRPEFSRLRPASLRRRQGRAAEPRRVFVGLGGTDPHNATERVLRIVRRQLPDAQVDVVLGASAPHLDRVRACVKTLGAGVKLHVASERVGELMMSADLAVGAGGSTAWERCCLGLPSVVVMTGADQRDVAGALSRNGAGVVVGDLAEVTDQEIARALAALHSDGDRLRSMGIAAARLCDGCGAGRVAAEMFAPKTRDSQSVRLRLAVPADKDIVYEWQTAPSTRRYFRDQSVPERSQHDRWFEAKLNDPLSIFCIVEVGGAPVGVLRLDSAGAVGRVPQYELSILVSPDRRDSGIGAAALAFARTMMPGSSFRAWVDARNTASHRLFVRAGYRPQGEYLVQAPAAPTESGEASNRSARREGPA